MKTTSEYIEDYVAHLRLERGFNEATVETYRTDLKRVSHLKKLPTSEDLLVEIRKLTTLKRSPTTIRKFIVTMRGLFKYLIQHGVTKEDPTILIRPPKKATKLPRYLTVEEMQKLLDSFDGAKHKSLLRTQAMIYLMYSCGLRCSELVNLKMSHVDLVRKTVLADGKGRKERLIPMSSIAALYLSRYLTEIRPLYGVTSRPSDPVFVTYKGTQMKSAAFYTTLVRLSKRAGIEKRVWPHMVRHSFATHLIQRGADIRIIQALLGHASIATTQIYTHVDDTKLHESIKKFHPHG